jgi:hypothetical protein
MSLRVSGDNLRWISGAHNEHQPESPDGFGSRPLSSLECISLVGKELTVQIADAPAPFRHVRDVLAVRHP